MTKLPFKMVRDTRIKTFQYGIFHRIPCTKWLHNIKVKDGDDSCDDYGGVDDIQHRVVSSHFTTL